MEAATFMWGGRVLKHLILVATLLHASAAQADEAVESSEESSWFVMPFDASGVDWKSGEGAALRLAPGVGLVFGEARVISVAHGFDVLSRSDPYHHWQIGYNDGPNGAYFGVRYQNQSHADQYEAGVTMGSLLASFGLGVIYDGEERSLRSVVLRGNLAVIAIPVALLFRERDGAEP